jgi:hypothetical protein
VIVGQVPNPRILVAAVWRSACLSSQLDAGLPRNRRLGLVDGWVGQMVCWDCFMFLGEY